MKFIDYVLLAIVAVWLAVVICYLIRRKKEGGCSGCNRCKNTDCTSCKKSEQTKE